MQHVIQATVVDEDVWDEIKVSSVQKILFTYGCETQVFP